MAKPPSARGAELAYLSSMMMNGRLPAMAGHVLCAFLAAAAALGPLPAPGHAFADAPAEGEVRIDRLVIDTARGPAAFQVELAATPEMLMQGLQHRRRLPSDAGMLFDFGPPRLVSMWMKNTYISLDMLFIDADGIVADIAERTTPLSLETIVSRVPVRAVLEVNAGTVAAFGIRAGDRVHHPIFARP